MCVRDMLLITATYLLFWEFSRFQPAEEAKITPIRDARWNNERLAMTVMPGYVEGDRPRWHNGLAQL